MATSVQTNPVGQAAKTAKVKENFFDGYTRLIVVATSADAALFRSRYENMNNIVTIAEFRKIVDTFGKGKSEDAFRSLRQGVPPLFLIYPEVLTSVEAWYEFLQADWILKKGAGGKTGVGGLTIGIASNLLSIPRDEAASLSQGSAIMAAINGTANEVPSFDVVFAANDRLKKREENAAGDVAAAAAAAASPAPPPTTTTTPERPVSPSTVPSVPLPSHPSGGGGSGYASANSSITQPPPPPAYQDPASTTAGRGSAAPVILAGKAPSVNTSLPPSSLAADDPKMLNLRVAQALPAAIPPSANLTPYGKSKTPSSQPASANPPVVASTSPSQPSSSTTTAPPHAPAAASTTPGNAVAAASASAVAPPYVTASSSAPSHSSTSTNVAATAPPLSGMGSVSKSAPVVHHNQAPPPHPLHASKSGPQEPSIASASAVAPTTTTVAPGAAGLKPGYDPNFIPSSVSSGPNSGAYVYSKDGPLDHSNLIVNYLPNEIANGDALRALFAQFGEVEHAKVPQAQTGSRTYGGSPVVHKGYGFVKFRQAADAARAVQVMNGSSLHGKTLKVNVAGLERGLFKKGPSGEPVVVQPQQQTAPPVVATTTAVAQPTVVLQSAGAQVATPITTADGRVIYVLQQQQQPTTTAAAAAPIIIQTAGGASGTGVATTAATAATVVAASSPPTTVVTQQQQPTTQAAVTVVDPTEASTAKPEEGAVAASPVEDGSALPDFIAKDLMSLGDGSHMEGLGLDVGRGGGGISKIVQQQGEQTQEQQQFQQPQQMQPQQSGSADTPQKIHGSLQEAKDEEDDDSVVDPKALLRHLNPNEEKQEAARVEEANPWGNSTTNSATAPLPSTTAIGESAASMTPASLPPPPLTEEQVKKEMVQVLSRYIRLKQEEAPGSGSTGNTSAAPAGLRRIAFFDLVEVALMDPTFTVNHRDGTFTNTPEGHTEF